MHQCLNNIGYHMNITWRQIVIVVVMLLMALPCSADTSSDLSNLPLITYSDFKYTGAFRLPKKPNGDSRVGNSEGPITLGADGKTFFIVSHPRQQAIAEYMIPELVISRDLSKLAMAVNVQPFTKVLDRPKTGNPQNMNRIGGMEYVDGELIVNTYEYYDANTDATHTTLVIRDAGKLASSTVDGYHQYEAKAHASGWISPIPPTLHALLGGTHIAGHSSGKPINSRHSVGPSAFVINPREDIVGGRAPGMIKTTPLLDFSLKNIVGDAKGQRGDYLKNKDGKNKLWTHLSRASYGFIIPGTRTYATIGFSGGHESGVGYKLTRSNGTSCPGYCSGEITDNHNYYWLWDLNDLLAVKNGTIKPYDVLPYEYGIIDTPFDNSSRRTKIVGGAYDGDTGILYLTLVGADTTQGRYEAQPVIIAYRFPDKG